MIETTLRKIIDRIPGDQKYRLYVIWSDDIPLYVGKSIDAEERVLSHLGTGSYFAFYGSSFDQKLKTYPGWRDFKVTLYTGLEFRGVSLSTLNYDIDRLEYALIYELSPVFNAMGKKKSRDNSDKWFKLYPEPIISFPYDEDSDNCQ